MNMLALTLPYPKELLFDGNFPPATVLGL